MVQCNFTKTKINLFIFHKTKTKSSYISKDLIVPYLYRFRYDENDAALMNRMNSLPITKLYKPKNLEATMQEFQLLSDCAIIKLARLQSWFIPNFYPFTFPGQLRGGPGTGPPPILDQVSAGNKSKDLLRLFIRTEGVTEIPRNILLIDTETGVKTFLPECVLRPTAQFFYCNVLPRTFSVALDLDFGSDTDQSSDSDNGSDDSDDDITFNVNPSGADNGQLNNTVPVGTNPQVASLNPRTLANLQSQFRFTPGLDGLGKALTFYLFHCFSFKFSLLQVL